MTLNSNYLGVPHVGTDMTLNVDLYGRFENSVLKNCENEIRWGGRCFDKRIKIILIPTLFLIKIASDIEFDQCGTKGVVCTY